jgi:hypothetical protein
MVCAIAGDRPARPDEDRPRQWASLTNCVNVTGRRPRRGVGEDGCWRRPPAWRKSPWGIGRRVPVWRGGWCVNYLTIFGVDIRLPCSRIWCADGHHAFVCGQDEASVMLWVLRLLAWGRPRWGNSASGVGPVSTRWDLPHPCSHWHANCMCRKGVDVPENLGMILAGNQREERRLNARITYCK